MSVSFNNRPAGADGSKPPQFYNSLDGIGLRAVFDPTAARSAALTIADHATDVEDLRDLLAVVGLLPDGEPADSRRVLGWPRA